MASNAICRVHYLILSCNCEENEEPEEISEACLLVCPVDIVSACYSLYRHFPNEVVCAVLSNSRCIYSFCSLSTFSSLIFLKSYAEDKA